MVKWGMKKEASPAKGVVATEPIVVSEKPVQGKVEVLPVRAGTYVQYFLSDETWVPALVYTVREGDRVDVGVISGRELVEVTEVPRGAGAGTWRLA